MLSHSPDYAAGGCPEFALPFCLSESEAGEIAEKTAKAVTSVLG